MYRQNSAPSLKKSNHGSPKVRGAHLSPPRNNGVRRASSERLMGKGGPSNQQRSTESEGRNEEELAQRTKILEQIQFLGSHLAGCMVEFLIEEVEKNVLHAYANAAVMGDETCTEVEEDDSVNLSEDDEEEEEEMEVSMTEVNEDSVANFADEEEDVMSPKEGVGASNGGKLKGPPLAKDQQPTRGLGVGKTRTADSSPNMPSRGLRNAPGSPRRDFAQVGSPKNSGRTLLVSPRRNSVQVGALSYSNPNTLRRPGQPFLTDDDDDEEEEDGNKFLTSSKKVVNNGLSSHGGTQDFRRKSTLPARLTADSPTRSNTKALRKSISPTAPNRKIGLARFDNDMDSSTNSLPKRPHRSVDMKSPSAIGNMDGSEFSIRNMTSTPARSRVESFEKSPTAKQAVRMFESKAASSASPSPTRITKTINKLQQSPTAKKPTRPGLARSQLMVKQGSVRHVMGIFESKSKESRPNRPAMPLLRENSVKIIIDALKDAHDDENILDESTKSEVDTGKNSKEAPELSSVAQRSGSKTPPRFTRNFSMSPDGSPKRGVQRNTSGIRMQRFLENKSVDRSNSGVKSFLDKKGSGSSHGSAGSIGRRPNRVVRKRSGNSVKRGVDRSPSGIRRALPKRTASGTGGKKGMPRRQFSFGSSSAGTKKSSSFGMFAKDKVTNKLSHDTRKQKRVFKTQNALRKLKKATEADNTPNPSDDGSEHSADDLDMEHVLGTMTLPLPCGIKHECALLFVDISGFTKLSTTLKVEMLSKTINAYFQLIVEHVQAFGGDILKFAGDAVFVEWRASATTLLEENEDDLLGGTYGGTGLGAEKAVITAAACAARIIDKCADYEVHDENGKKVATLNLHCAIGFGEVVGVHLGNADRMEYFIIGEPIAQVSKAMDLGKMGEVVASPACLRYLDGETSDEPKVILSKANKLMNPKLILVKAGKKSKSTLVDRLEDWDVAALKSLQKTMSPYVHPVVVENQLLQKGYGSAQERFTSEAEIRDVFTVFIQPMVSVQVEGDSNKDREVLKKLHDIMIIVNNELRRFKGQLRQYTVDDKGMEIIADLGEPLLFFLLYV